MTSLWVILPLVESNKGNGDLMPTPLRKKFTRKYKLLVTIIGLKGTVRIKLSRETRKNYNTIRRGRSHENWSKIIAEAILTKFCRLWKHLEIQLCIKVVHSWQTLLNAILMCYFSELKLTISLKTTAVITQCSCLASLTQLMATEVRQAEIFTV